MTTGIQMTMVTICVLLDCCANGLVCKYCFGNTWESCGAGDINCMKGYEHCYAGYLLTGESGKNVVYTRGCTICPNEVTGCDVINSTMPPNLYQPIRGCKIECCEEDECNVESPTLPVVLPARSSQDEVAVICASLLAIAFMLASTVLQL